MLHCCMQAGCWLLDSTQRPMANEGMGKRSERNAPWIRGLPWHGAREDARTRDEAICAPAQGGTDGTSLSGAPPPASSIRQHCMRTEPPVADVIIVLCISNAADGPSQWTNHSLHSERPHASQLGQLGQMADRDKAARTSVRRCVGASCVRIRRTSMRRASVSCVACLTALRPCRLRLRPRRLRLRLPRFPPSCPAGRRVRHESSRSCS